MENYTREIKHLHQFFEDYLSGKIEPEPLTRFEQVMDSGFTIVDSGGDIIDRDGIIAYVRDAYGKRPDFRIWTENVILRQHIGELLIVTYEEWQTITDITTCRTSTAVFKEDDTAPDGLIWLHVHESGLREIPTE